MMIHWRHNPFDDIQGYLQILLRGSKGPMYGRVSNVERGLHRISLNEGEIAGILERIQLLSK